ncbi:hypothetical protein Pelo_8908 [Pelomyxa schiedti]|nr:hypothetical protein Pelo_8908 [Pelomyxa schiedti]
MDLSSRIDSSAPRVPPQRHYADLTNDYHTDNRERCTVSDTSRKAANDACRSQAPVTVYVAVHACVDAAAAAPHGVSCSACRGGRTLTITTAAARTMACIRNNNAQRQNQDSITSSGYGNSNVAVDGDETGTETETETETESEVEPVSGLNSRRPHTRSQSRMKLCVSRTPICQLLDKEEGQETPNPSLSPKCPVNGVELIPHPNGGKVPMVQPPFAMPVD